MKMKMRQAALVLAMAGLASAAKCAGMSNPGPAWATTWQQAAFVALLIGYLIAALAYMIGIGFNMQKFVMFARKELMYMALISILVGALYVVDNITNESLAPAFGSGSLVNATFPARAGVQFCGGASTLTPIASNSWVSIQDHTIDYAICLRDKNVDYFKSLMGVNFIIGFASSVNLAIYPLGLVGFGFSPGMALKPMLDTLGYVLYMLSITIMQLKVQEVVLCFSKYYMFSMVLPLGIALSAFPVTRSAGGALISVAIGFYIVLPVTYLISEEIVQDYCQYHDNCSFTADEAVGQFRGSARDIADQMFGDRGEGASQLTSMLSLNGSLGPMMYLVGFASTLLPLASLIITLMFVKSFSGLFGSEVDFSTLIKVI